MSEGSNDFRKSDLFAQASVFGKAEGEGRNMRPTFGCAAFMAAADAVITSGKGEDDVFALFGEYTKGVNAAFNKVGAFDRSEKSLKVQVSKLRNFVIVGGMPMFLKSRDNGTNNAAREFINLVDDRIAALCDVKDKAVPVYDKFIEVMRAQRAKVKAGIEAPLTRDEIDAAINKPAAEPEEVKQVRSAMNSLRKLAKAWPNSAEYLTAAAAVLAPRVATLEVDEEANDIYEAEQLLKARKAKLTEAGQTA
jgi:hypothetical protein